MPREAGLEKTRNRRGHHTGQVSPMTYKDWETRVPTAISDDPLWTVTAYRLALFASDLSG